jgi:carboxymethylenebutenolidase
MTSFDAPAGPLPAYLAVPEGGGPWPGVVVVHDAFGMSDDVRKITDRFAAAGYLAIAPALFRRGNRLRCVVTTLKSLQGGKGPAVDDVLAAAASLRADDRCTGKVGSVGFCMGGGFALLTSPSGVFDAAAPNYGIWPGNREELSGACPTVASYGAQDRMLTGAAAELEQRLTAGGVPHDVKEYPGVGGTIFKKGNADAATRS